MTAAASALIGGTALASHTIKVPSKVSIKSGSGLRFSGKVTTGSYEPCQQQRRVILFKVVSNGPDEAVGRGTTSNKGAWTASPQGSAGISLARFYAKVKPLSQGAAGTIYACQAGRSKIVKATP